MTAWLMFKLAVLALVLLIVGWAVAEWVER